MVDTALVKKFTDVEKSMNDKLIERNDPVHGAILALLSGTHHFQLGEPGVAKSLLTRTLARHIIMEDDSYFERLLTPYSTPDELFGPVSIKALRDDRYRRNTDKMLPEAQIAFLDEIFKANSAILNALLTALNERIFHNDTATTKIPLRSMFCASNELPASEELNALYDRIHLRYIVRPLSSSSSFATMLRLVDSTPDAVLTFEDINKATNEVEQVVVGDKIVDTIIDLRNSLRRSEVNPTDRRFREALRIIKAEAWLNGRSEVISRDLSILQHVLWNTQAEIQTVVSAVLSLASPVDQKAAELLSEIEGLYTEVITATAEADGSQQALHRKLIQTFTKLKRISEQAAELKRNDPSSEHHSVTVLRERVETVIEEITKLISEYEGK